MGRQKIDSIIVIGGGGHAKVLIGILKKSGAYELVGYTDVRDVGKLLGVPYLGTDSVLEQMSARIPDCCVAVGVGKVELNKNRLKIVDRVLGLGFRLPAVLSPHAVVNEDVKIGDGTVVFDGAVINPGARIGRASIINTNSTVEHDCVIGDNVHIAPGANLSGGVHVGTNCIIGTGASVVQYVSICDDCLIGAGAAVSRDIREPGTYVGNPVRKIS